MSELEELNIKELKEAYESIDRESLSISLAEIRLGLHPNLPGNVDSRKWAIARMRVITACAIRGHKYDVNSYGKCTSCGLIKSS